MIPRHIYKCRVIMDVVVEAKDEAEALEAVQRTAFADGVPTRYGAIERVHRLDDLPPDWTGQELAFSRWDRAQCIERSIKSILAEQPA